MLRLLTYFIDCVIWFIQDIHNLLKFNKIFVCGFYKRGRKGILHNNWGDDINVFFFEAITDFKVYVLNNSHLYRFITPNNYSCIGSIIGYFTNSKTVIWGSGLISEDMAIPIKPQKVCSVRGPLTREVLLQKGIECPAIYGDPALLISKFYTPKVEKKYSLGIIPHIIDEKCKSLKNFIENHPEVLIISMSNYQDWREIPKQICSCEKIISSSLHGLIISDSYGIPNLWAQFSDKIVGGTFKYRDYFESVGRIEIEPFIIESSESLDSLYSNGNYIVAKHIDYLSILQACPFKERIKDYKKICQ